VGMHFLRFKIVLKIQKLIPRKQCAVSCVFFNNQPCGGCASVHLAQKRRVGVKLKHYSSTKRFNNKESQTLITGLVRSIGKGHTPGNK
jgi:hypothetical protein